MSSEVISADDLHSRLAAIVADVLEIDPARLEESGRFYDDYGADSLAGLEIVTRIETEMGVEIPDTAFARIVSLGALRQVVDEYRARAADGPSDG